MAVVFVSGLMLVLLLAAAQGAPHPPAARRKLLSSGAASNGKGAAPTDNCFMVTVSQSTTTSHASSHSHSQRRLLSATMAQHVDAVVAKAKAALGEGAIAHHKSLGPVFPGFSIHTHHQEGAARLMDFLDATEEVVTYRKCVTVSLLPPTKTSHPKDVGPPPLSATINGIYQSDDGAAVRSMPGFENLYGQGIKVAVIDAGIDFRHPGLGGCLGPKCKVLGGYDYTSPSRTNSSGLRGCAISNHGTQVASVIAANYTMQRTTNGTNTTVTFLGVAPGVNLLAYRIFNCSDMPTAEDPVISAAMLKAYEDGADVINLSLGSDGTWLSTINIIAENLAQLGVVVVQSAGNAADKGLFIGGAATPPADNGRQSTLPIYTASTDDPRLSGASIATFATANMSITAGVFSYFSAAVEASPFEQMRGLPLRLTASMMAGHNYTADGCNGTDIGDMTGAIALIRRGTCFFTEKIANAAAAGAAGIIVYNRLPGSLQITIVPEGNITIFTMTIDGNTGDYLAAWIRNATLAHEELPTITAFRDSIALPSLSSYTSWGPTPDLCLTPDVTAPGGSVYALFFWDDRTLPAPTTIVSGTSFSAPYISGCVSLYLQAARSMGLNPTPQQVRDALVATATPIPTVDFTTGTVTNHIESPMQTGTGRINLAAAIAALSAPVSLSPANLLLPTGTATVITTFNITNASPSATVHYTLRHIPTDSISTVDSMAVPTFDPSQDPPVYIGSPFTPSVADHRLSVAFLNATNVRQGTSPATATVTVAAGATTTVQVQFTVPSDLLNNSYLVSGYITATPIDPAAPTPGMGSNFANLTLPYLGYTSSFSSIPILQPDVPGGLGLPAGAMLMTLANNSMETLNASLMLLVDTDGKLLPPYDDWNVNASNAGGSPPAPSPLWQVLPVYINDQVPDNMPTVYLDVMHQYDSLNVSLVEVDPSTGTVKPGGKSYFLDTSDRVTVQRDNAPVPYLVPTVYHDAASGTTPPIPDGTYAAYFTMERVNAIADIALGVDLPTVLEEWLSPPFMFVTPDMPPAEYTDASK